jgi:hypothetical protein
MGASLLIPTAEEETADPTAADARYESAVDEIRRRAKAAGNAAVLRENINYGFSRNLLALRPYALSGAILCAAIFVAKAWYVGGRTWNAILTVDRTPVFLLAAYTAAFLLLVRKSVVRHQAEAYASTLLETIEEHPPQQRPAS